MVGYRLLLSALCFLFCLQGCVHGGLDDCPPMVNYAVAFEYTNHTGKATRAGGAADRFYDDVKKINLYVFDEHNLIYTTTTGLSPYETNFNIPLDLPMGNYHIIAWGNVLDGGSFSGDTVFAVTPDPFEKGVTTLAEARLILKREAERFSRKELEKLFYGEKRVEIPLYMSRIDTIPLMNNTNHVRVVLNWDHTGVVSPTEEVVDYDEVIVRLTGSNAVYDFNNNLVSNDVVEYVPYAVDTTGAILITDQRNETFRIFYYPPDPIKEVTDSTVYDFTVLRLFPDNELKLTVLRKKSEIMDVENLFAPIGDPDRNNPDYGHDIVGTVSGTEGFAWFMKDKLNITSSSAMQATFDKYENYRIDVCFRFDKLANTFFTGGIHVTDWRVIEQGAIPGHD